MTEPRFAIEAPRAGTGPAETPAEGRKPFVAPAVEEMGGLAELTLIGGTV